MKQWNGSWYGVEFWKEGAEKTFNKAKDSMIEHGYTEEESVVLLLELYAAIMSEFGE